MKLLSVFRREKKTDIATLVTGGDVLPSADGRRSPFEQFQVRSLVSDGMEINGDIISRTGAAIDGVVNGDVTIEGTNLALLLRQSARVNGTVKAPMVLVRGIVYGDIEARFARLYPGSRVHGRIRSARLTVDDGAVIANGCINIDDSECGAGAVIEKRLNNATPPPADRGAAVVPIIDPVERMNAMVAAAGAINRRGRSDRRASMIEA